jgi:DNA-binding transcriptional MerR regulator
LFNDIIAKDLLFGEALSEIKAVYEEWIKGKVGYVVENSQLKLDISHLSQKIKDFEVANKSLKENLKKISLENAKVGKEIELKDKQYRSLQEHLIKITNIDRNNFPPSEETWKLILVENKTYLDICECMKKDIKNLKKNENKLLDLIDHLRNQGYPVDEIYKKIVFPKYSKKKKKDKEVGSEEEEYLITGRPKIVFKPDFVPGLNLEERNQEFEGKFKESSEEIS